MAIWMHHPCSSRQHLVLHMQMLPEHRKTVEAGPSPLSSLNRQTNKPPAKRIPQPWATGVLTPERLLADEVKSFLQQLCVPLRGLLSTSSSLQLQTPSSSLHVVRHPACLSCQHSACCLQLTPVSAMGWCTGLTAPASLLQSAMRSPAARPPLASRACCQSPGVPQPLVGRHLPACYDVVHLVHSMGCRADPADVLDNLDWVPGLSVEWLPGSMGLVPCLVVAGLQPMQIVKLLVQLAPQMCGPTEEKLQQAASNLEEVLEAFCDPAKFYLLDGSKAPGVACEGQGPAAMRQQEASSTPARSRLQVSRGAGWPPVRGREERFCFIPACAASYLHAVWHLCPAHTP